MDGEGIEEYFLKNLNHIENIQYIIFELHNHMFKPKKLILSF